MACHVRRRARTTTLSGVVSEAVTPQMALITASATCCRTAALRQAFGSQVILCESVSREHGCCWALQACWMNGIAALLVLVNDNFTMLHLSRAKAGIAGCKSTAHLKCSLL